MPGRSRIYVWEKVKDYLTKAGTTIFVASIVIWFILNYGIHGMTADVTQSFGAKIGKVLAPLLVPAGLGTWQIVVALISGLSAKEVVISSFFRALRCEQCKLRAGDGSAQRFTGYCGIRCTECLLP